MLRRYIRILYNGLRVVVREWTGEAEYERHVRHCARRGAPSLDRGRFFARRLEQRYGKQSRCC